MNNTRKWFNYVLNKNLLVGYKDNILIKSNRSNGEIKFEKWYEKSKRVK